MNEAGKQPNKQGRRAQQTIQLARRVCKLINQDAARGGGGGHETGGIHAGAGKYLRDSGSSVVGELSARLIISCHLLPTLNWPSVNPMCFLLPPNRNSRCWQGAQKRCSRVLVHHSSHSISRRHNFWVAGAVTRSDLLLGPCDVEGRQQ